MKSPSVFKAANHHTSRNFLGVEPRLPPAPSLRAWKILLASLFIGAYFLLLSFDGLRAYFTGDDGMNLVMLHGCFATPLWHLAVSALAVCTPAYRPVGGLFYRLLYAFFHFDPLPFRVACYCFLGLNLALAGFLMRCWSGLWEVAAVGTLLFSFHGMLVHLYYNTGTIYDILCATFYMLAFLHYIYARAAQTVLTAWPTATLIALYALALDTKEMAASLPLVFLAYELLYHGLPQTGAASLLRRFRPILLLLAITAAFTIVKTALPSPISMNPLYQPSLSPHLFLENLAAYINLLLYQQSLFTSRTILPVLAVLLAASWFLRSRTMLFALSFALLTMLPVLIIPFRAGFVLYLPYLGWSGWAATVLVHARLALLRWITHNKKLFPRTQTMTQALLLLLIAISLYPIHQRKRNDLRFALRLEQSQMRDILEQMKQRFPAFPHGARILILDDPLRPNDWGLSFLTRLEYNDPTLTVVRRKDLPNSNSVVRHQFTYLLAFQNQTLVRLPE